MLALAALPWYTRVNDRLSILPVLERGSSYLDGHGKRPRDSSLAVLQVDLAKHGFVVHTEAFKAERR